MYTCIQITITNYKSELDFVPMYVFYIVCPCYTISVHGIWRNYKEKIWKIWDQYFDPMYVYIVYPCYT